MTDNLKTYGLLLLIILASLLSLILPARMMHESKHPMPLTPHALQVLDRYCQEKNMTINRTIYGPLIIPREGDEAASDPDREL